MDISSPTSKSKTSAAARVILHDSKTRCFAQGFTSPAPIVHLAGKSSAQDLDNGVLTPMEVSNLNLRGTELVVLSACDTGRGDIKNGEGVFGLRRALQEAGAQKVLMSLWSEPDAETLELMESFCSRWLSGIEAHEALNEAQLEMREKVKAKYDGKDLPY